MKKIDSLGSVSRTIIIIHQKISEKFLLQMKTINNEWMDGATDGEFLRK